MTLCQTKISKKLKKKQTKLTKKKKCLNFCHITPYYWIKMCILLGVCKNITIMDILMDMLNILLLTISTIS